MCSPCALLIVTLATRGSPFMACGPCCTCVESERGCTASPPLGPLSSPASGGRQPPECHDLRGLTPPPAETSRGVLAVVEQTPDGFTRRRLAQRADEAVVTQAAGDVLQGAQVVAGAVLRRDQQHEHVDGLAVEAVEGDAPARDADGADQAVHGGVLAVRDGHGAA